MPNRIFYFLIFIFLCTRGSAQEDNLWKSGDSQHSVIDFNYEPPILRFVSDTSHTYAWNSIISICNKKGNKIELFGGAHYNFDTANKVYLFTGWKLFGANMQLFPGLENYNLDDANGISALWKNDTTFLLFNPYFDVYNKKLVNRFDILYFNLMNDKTSLIAIDSTTYLQYSKYNQPAFYHLPQNNCAFMTACDSISNLGIGYNTIYRISYNTTGQLQFIPLTTYLLDTVRNWFSEFSVANNEQLIVLKNRPQNYSLDSNRTIYLFKLMEDDSWKSSKILFTHTNIGPYGYDISDAQSVNRIFFITEDNRFLYAGINDYRPSIPIHQRVTLVQFDLNEQDIWGTRYEFKRNAANGSFLEFKLGPNGKLYAGRSSTFEIRNYNRKGDSCQIVPFNITDSLGRTVTDYISYFFLQLPTTLGFYKKATFNSFATCKGTEYAFYNTSDTQYWKKYCLYFGDGDSINFYPNDFPLQKDLADNLKKTWTHTYKQPGKYCVKLKAFNENGFVWYSDSIEINQAPKANFTVADTTGCQWIAYKTIDKSIFPPKLFGPQPNSYTYNWQYGDGKDTTLLFATVPAAAAASVGHTYTQNGLYKVSLTVNDGYCADTFSLQNKVTILPAPQPGILLNPSTAMGCSPLDIAAQRRYTDPIDSAVWQMGEGSQQTAYTNPAAIQHTYYHTLSNTQNYLLQQTLYGPTGCVTRDSLWLAVQPGFENGYIPTLIRASVENENTALVQWIGHPHAKGYTLFKDNAIATETNDTFFVEAYTQVQHSAYWITANNACDDASEQSNSGKLILLTGNNANNKTALLQWTAYQDWSKEMGVLHYTIEAKNNSTGAFEALNNNDTTHYTDNNFIQSGYYNRCYRITATQANNTNIVSHSNTLCLGYESVIFVPNAFSPNNDGLNDVFEPFNIGFKSYTLSVYNRWGEKIAEGRNWDGTTLGQTVPNGIYFYRISGKTGKDENVFLNGQVTVVR
jgi:gliding motility-associated-like protein